MCEMLPNYLPQELHSSSLYIKISFYFNLLSTLFSISDFKKKKKVVKTVQLMHRLKHLDIF